MQPVNTDRLLCQWQTTLQTFDVDKLAAEEAFTQLVTAYSSPHRSYHTLQHINYVLSTIDILQIYTQNLAAVQLAAWLHDVVYDPQAQDNEEKSAAYACELLSNLSLPQDAIATVTRLILHTKHHQAADDDDSQVLLDADLAILAANLVQYQEYANAIRQEYAWLSDADYIQGRNLVLNKFLQRQRIYFTPLMFEFAEPAARDNIKREIKNLLLK
ncbi:hypothetical protein H6G76_28710 [Nostoc sp. FACHB-152]|uniref:HD domain-containing protein n=1 Tax=unclassified Nostoc TaxID=2593658 RepID=UPI001682452F|nr:MULTISPECIES: hypothetical protein [unclassified Nostoc]MBD2451040.1 hypothetical protein [Nostoc sp. FACHB-152]MBD2471078.1 hypothetical protein [Nostoc sp. FACHB-145]